MEDEKLAAYYDELTRKGGGAARFKQGLGYSSSTNDAVPSRGSALSTTASSFLSNFVKASSPSKSSQFEKQAQLQSIQNKLGKKPKEKIRSPSPSRDEQIRNSSRRSLSPSPIRDRSRVRHSRRRSKSRSRSRDRHSRRRSRSRSRDWYSRRRSWSRDRRSRQRSRERSKRRTRSPSPEKSKKQSEIRNNGRKGGGIDFAKLIDGYDNMTPADKVKAKMKFQLSKTAENDETMGKGSGWERFDFNSDAPLDDADVEGLVKFIYCNAKVLGQANILIAAEDDAVLVKHIGQSFRFSAVAAKKEEEIKAAHDEAMFGASSFPPPSETEDEAEEESQRKGNIDTAPVKNLLSDQLHTMQQGSWRDRARKA